MSLDAAFDVLDDDDRCNLRTARFTLSPLSREDTDAILVHFGDPRVTEATWKSAAASVWSGWSPVPWSTDSVWASTNLAAVTGNPPATMSSQLLPYAEGLANQARLAGYTVKSPVAAVSSP